NPLATAMSGRKTGKTYRLGDRIEVRVESIDKIEGKVELRLPGGEDGRKGRRREQRGRRRS
ncbi:MAG: hypothetical protein M3327_01560, partial [Actinomycetota bacterium]|nr:hypothetical protein [Actinomycetota bacterium]